MHERKLREREDKAMKTKSRGTGNNSNDPNHKKWRYLTAKQLHVANNQL